MDEIQLTNSPEVNNGVYDASEYYNPNYEPYAPYYYYPNYDPCYPWPVITTKVIVNGCPSELWPLLQELTEIKNLLKQILDKQGS